LVRLKKYRAATVAKKKYLKFGVRRRCEIFTEYIKLSNRNNNTTKNSVAARKKMNKSKEAHIPQMHTAINKIKKTIVFFRKLVLLII
jgi:hypothetical protein